MPGAVSGEQGGIRRRQIAEIVADKAEINCQIAIVIIHTAVGFSTAIIITGRFNIRRQRHDTAPYSCGRRICPVQPVIIIVSINVR